MTVEAGGTYARAKRVGLSGWADLYGYWFQTVSLSVGSVSVVFYYLGLTHLDRLVYSPFQCCPLSFRPSCYYRPPP